MSVIVRFAPSPTGHIHIGNLRGALINWLFARSQQGKFMFRLDDTDQIRSLPEYIKGVHEDMKWLGLDYDIYAEQSKRKDRYQEAMQQLIDQGRLYPCYETKDELERKRKFQIKKGMPPVYDRSALKASQKEMQQWQDEGRRPYWRFKLNDQEASWHDLIKGDLSIQTTSSLSDPVLVKEDGTFLYTLSSVVDDIDFNITHIIRGEDHVTNTGVQIQLFEALTQQPIKIQFAHFSLLLDKDGQPLSKRINSFAIKNLRDTGFDAMAVICFVAGLGSSKSPVISYDLEDLISSFDLDLLHGGARVDEAALNNIQVHLLHIKPFDLAQQDFHEYDVKFTPAEWTVIRESLNTKKDMKTWDSILHDFVALSDSFSEDEQAFLKKAADCCPSTPELSEQDWKQWIETLQQDRKGRALYHPLRLALTGLEMGPELKQIFFLLGSNQVKSRLEAAVQKQLNS